MENNIYKKIILENGMYEALRCAENNATFNTEEEYIDFLKAVLDIYNSLLLAVAERTKTSAISVDNKVKENKYE